MRKNYIPPKVIEARAKKNRVFKEVSDMGLKCSYPNCTQPLTYADFLFNGKYCAKHFKIIENAKG